MSTGGSGRGPKWVLPPFALYRCLIAVICCHLIRFLDLQYHRNAVVAGALPQTPLGEFTALLHIPSWIWTPSLFGDKKGGREEVRDGDRERALGMGRMIGMGGEEERNEWNFFCLSPPHKILDPPLSMRCRISIKSSVSS